ncbi:hypothetical protein ACFV4N_01480 [Actinosynnema sp. NPDC059797]
MRGGLLWSSRPRRLTYLALWVPNGLVVGGDSLYVPYAPGAAGAMYAFGALGMFLGDLAVGRLVPPAAVAIASVGFAASLALQERLMSLTPDDLTGQALGLYTTGMAACQGIGALLAGTPAQLTSPAAAITLMAAGSITATLVLVALGRRAGRQPVPRPDTRPEPAGTAPSEP